LQADKLKAALMQYKQNQLSVISDQESPKSGVSRLTPDVSKDVLAKKESHSLGKKAKQLSAKSPSNNSKEHMLVKKPSLSASKIVKPSSVKSTPDFSSGVPTKKASLSTGKKTKLSSAKSSRESRRKRSLSASTSVKPSSVKSTADVSTDVFAIEASLSPRNSVKQSSVTKSVHPTPKTNENEVLIEYLSHTFMLPVPVVRRGDFW